MRVVICDDDAVVRSVVRGLVAAAGGEVLAETDSAIVTQDLIERFDPDVVVLDVVLTYGSGVEVLEQVARMDGAAPYVIVFTAYDAPASASGDRVDAVAKPDFDTLARLLATAPERRTERRRPTRAVGVARPTVNDGHDFFRMLAEARPGDHLVSFPAESGELDRLAETVRGAVRAQDRVLRRSNDVLALLIDGGEASVAALRDRLRALVPEAVAASRSMDVGDDPVTAFDTLGAGT